MMQGVNLMLKYETCTTVGCQTQMKRNKINKSNNKRNKFKPPGPNYLFVAHTAETKEKIIDKGCFLGPKFQTDPISATFTIHWHHK